jgi:RNA polymerase sigma-70 factor (ECF subfamily)
VVQTHEQVAFRAAYAVVGNAADAEEVAQDAFLKAYRALGRFRRGAPFRPWLLRIVGNEARNRVRSRERRHRLAERVGAEAASGGAVPPPEANVLAAEQHDRLFEAIDRLGAEERLAVIGRFFIGLSDEETAAALGIRRGAVKMRVFRALERLRRELEEAR